MWVNNKCLITEMFVINSSQNSSWLITKWVIWTIIALSLGDKWTQPQG